MEYTVRRAYGKMRKAGQVYLEQNHYMKSSGGSGQLFVVEHDGGQIVGACLIDATAFPCALLFGFSTVLYIIRILKVQSL